MRDAMVPSVRQTKATRNDGNFALCEFLNFRLKTQYMVCGKTVNIFCLLFIYVFTFERFKEKKSCSRLIEPNELCVCA